MLCLELGYSEARVMGIILRLGTSQNVAKYPRNPRCPGHVCSTHTYILPFCFIFFKAHR